MFRFKCNFLQSWLNWSDFTCFPNYNLFSKNNLENTLNTLNLYCAIPLPLWSETTTKNGGHRKCFLVQYFYRPWDTFMEFVSKLLFGSFHFCNFIFGCFCRRSYENICLFFISSCPSCLANGKHRTENHATKVTKKPKTKLPKYVMSRASVKLLKTI